MPDNARAPWISIVLAGLLAFVVSMAVIAATVAGYAFAIAIKANGPPDPHKLSVFASRVPPMLGPFVLTLLVLLAARWVVRRARSTRLFHGVLVGVVATLPADGEATPAPTRKKRERAAPAPETAPGDLALTTDYRDVLAELLSKRLGNARIDQVFPGYVPQMRGLAQGGTGE